MLSYTLKRRGDLLAVTLKECSSMLNFNIKPDDDPVKPPGK